MIKDGLTILVAFCLLGTPLLQAQQQPQLHEEVTVRWWLVPVYAVNKTGAPVLNLAPDDLEVYIKNIKVEQFDIHKKEFNVTETKKGAAPAPKPQAPAQRKMVFLVFDAAFSPYNLLAKAKAIAETVIAQSDKSAQYVLLSIEPMQGLRYISGPTRDLDAIARDMKKFVTGKKPDYMLSSLMDSSSIRNVYPGGRFLGESRGIPFNPRDTPQEYASMLERNDYQTKRRLASAYTSALMTLNLVLGNFREYSKVIYLYSCGIPSDAFDLRQETQEARGGGANEWVTSLSPDTVAFSSLTMIGKYLNKSGALLFLINPAGTRLWQADADSGEASLRILATESGGRYYEGADKEIAAEVNSMEGGYYEISFPDKPEYEGQELSFEIRSKKPDVTIYTVKNVGREKGYLEMTELEREVLVLNILSQGPYSQAKQRVMYIEGEAVQEGDSLSCRLPLPPDIARTEWTIYRVARNLSTGNIFMDRDIVVPNSQNLDVRMKWRGKDYRHDIVLAHSKTGTIVVWK